MNSKIKRTLFIGAIVFILGSGFPLFTFAEKDTVVEKNVGFSVQAIRPETQVDPSLSFFYPAVVPGEKQILQLKIVNTSGEKLALDLNIVNASTSINGNIDYSQVNAQLDESLKTPLTKLVSIADPSLTLKKDETKVVEIKISPSAEAFSGVKLGAIRVLKHLDEGKKNKGVATNYGYTIGILLTEDKKPYNVGGDLLYKTAAAKIINGYKTAAVNFQNPNPYVIQNLEMSAKLYKKGSSKVIGEKNLENMSIAPNTSFDFPIQLGLGNLEAGSYRVKITAQNDQDFWNWDEEFTVSPKQASEVNKKSVYKLTLPKMYNYLFALLAGLTIAAIALLQFFSLKNKKKQKKKINKRKGKREKRKTHET